MPLLALGGGIALLLVGATALGDDTTPLLSEPVPDLRLPLAVAGLALGVFASRWLSRRIPVRRHRARWLIYLLAPIVTAVTLMEAGSRIAEVVSFSEPGIRRVVAMPVVRKERRAGGRRLFGTRTPSLVMEVASPFGRRTVGVQVGAALFAQAVPGRDCLSVETETARNGMVRLVRVGGVRSPC